MSIVSQEQSTGLPADIWRQLNYPPRIKINDTLTPPDLNTENPYSHAAKYTSAILGLAHRADISPKKIENAQAFTVEWAAMAALRPALAPYGFGVHLAPAELENGLPQRRETLPLAGVDLVVFQKATTPHPVELAINMKLRERRVNDGFGYDPRCDAPRINCSVGSWNTPDNQDIRTWLEDRVIYGMLNQRSIKHMPEFRAYLLMRISRVLGLYTSFALRAHHDGTEHARASNAPFWPDGDKEMYVERLQNLYEFFHHIGVSYVRVGRI